MASVRGEAISINSHHWNAFPIPARSPRRIQQVEGISMRMSRLEFEAHQARIASQRKPTTRLDKHADGDIRESDLHADILNECKRRGWIAFHGSMAHKTFRTKGEADFCCLADGGRVLFVECKTSTGKLSPEQQGIMAWMSKLGHTFHVVRSFSDFLRICEEALKSDNRRAG